MEFGLLRNFLSSTKFDLMNVKSKRKKFRSVIFSSFDHLHWLQGVCLVSTLSSCGLLWYLWICFQNIPLWYALIIPPSCDEVCSFLPFFSLLICPFLFYVLYQLRYHLPCLHCNPFSPRSDCHLIFSLTESWLNQTTKPWELREWSLIKEALDFYTNSHSQSIGNIWRTVWRICNYTDVGV